mmetsp:Transcript_58942/g.108904  ORF Transcript_58942/g.108904 Transcript_58942/m.108904 type:complete len:147 (-) Transcript_58942:104-544(-)
MAPVLMHDDPMACEDASEGGMSEVLATFLFFVIGYSCFLPRVVQSLHSGLQAAAQWSHSMTWSTGSEHGGDISRTSNSSVCNVELDDADALGPPDHEEKRRELVVEAEESDSATYSAVGQSATRDCSDHDDVPSTLAGFDQLIAAA